MFSGNVGSCKYPVNPAKFCCFLRMNFLNNCFWMIAELQGCVKHSIKENIINKFSDSQGGFEGLVFWV